MAVAGRPRWPASWAAADQGRTTDDRAARAGRPDHDRGHPVTGLGRRRGSRRGLLADPGRAAGAGGREYPPAVRPPLARRARRRRRRPRGERRRRLAGRGPPGDIGRPRLHAGRHRRSTSRHASTCPATSARSSASSSRRRSPASTTRPSSSRSSRTSSTGSSARQPSDKQTWTADIEPWFGGQLAVGMGVPNAAALGGASDLRPRDDRRPDDDLGRHARRRDDRPRQRPVRRDDQGPDEGRRLAHLDDGRRLDEQDDLQRRRSLPERGHAERRHRRDHRHGHARRHARRREGGRRHERQGRRSATTPT